MHHEFQLVDFLLRVEVVVVVVVGVIWWPGQSWPSASPPLLAGEGEEREGREATQPPNPAHHDVHEGGDGHGGVKHGNGHPREERVQIEAEEEGGRGGIHLHGNSAQIMGISVMA